MTTDGDQDTPEEAVADAQEVSVQAEDQATRDEAARAVELDEALIDTENA